VQIGDRRALDESERLLELRVPFLPGYPTITSAPIATVPRAATRSSNRA
jgi:hypothetical protein